MKMILARLTGALIYLAGTGVWTFLMLLFGSLRCDDSCSAVSTSWGDDANAWQYDLVPYLGLVGFLLAILALTLSPSAVSWDCSSSRSTQESSS